MKLSVFHIETPATRHWAHAGRSGVAAIYLEHDSDRPWRGYRRRVFDGEDMVVKKRHAVVGY